MNDEDLFDEDLFDRDGTDELLGDYVHWWDTLSQADQVWESQQCVLMMLHQDDIDRRHTLEDGIDPRLIPMVDGEQHPAPNPDYDEIPF